VCPPRSEDGALRRCSNTNGVLLLLAFLAVAQLLVQGLRLSRPERLPLAWLQAGDTLPGLRVDRPEGRNTPLLLGKPTVLLVFGSECPHCLEVAPLWRSWLETKGSDWEVLVVSFPDRVRENRSHPPCRRSLRVALSGQPSPGTSISTALLEATRQCWSERRLRM
jgi:hypothetical protein